MGGYLVGKSMSNDHHHTDHHHTDHHHHYHTETGGSNAPANFPRSITRQNVETDCLQKYVNMMECFKGSSAFVCKPQLSEFTKCVKSANADTKAMMTSDENPFKKCNSEIGSLIKDIESGKEEYMSAHYLAQCLND